MKLRGKAVLGTAFVYVTVKKGHCAIIFVFKIY